MAMSSQKFIARNRAPRVQIEYDVEVYGSQKKVQLPFVMGVMADFYLVLDTSDPDKSVMVVIQPDGFVQQYEVRLPPKKDRSHWVVALERQGPDAWKKLSFKN